MEVNLIGADLVRLAFRSCDQGEDLMSQFSCPVGKIGGIDDLLYIRIAAVGMMVVMFVVVFVVVTVVVIMMVVMVMTFPFVTFPLRQPFWLTSSSRLTSFRQALLLVNITCFCYVLTIAFVFAK